MNNCMRVFFMRGVLIVFSCLILIGCDESSLEIPFFEFSRVTACERDELKTYMTHGEQGISEYSVFIEGSFVSKGSVRRTGGSISCTINDIVYDIKLSNTRGGLRAESVRASNKSGARLYTVEYWYNEENYRLRMARIDGVESMPIYTHYEYTNDSVVIDDVGTEYVLALSSEANLGYVCNVLDFSGAPYTTKYVINPDLYFLNIYGVPVEYLPYGQMVTYSNDRKSLMSVGKYSCEY